MGERRVIIVAGNVDRAELSRELLSGDAVTVSAYTGNTGTAAGSYTAQATALAGAAAANYRLPANAAHAWKITTTANSFVIQPAISGWIRRQPAWAAPRAWWPASRCSWRVWPSACATRCY